MFIKRLIRKLYRDPDLEGDSGGGGSYTPPADFTPEDTASMEKGLAAMDAEFGDLNDDDDGDAVIVDKEGATTNAPAAPDAPAAPPAELVEGAPNTFKSSTGKIVDTTKPPAGWSPEDAVGFETLAEPVRKAIHNREDQFHKGIEAFKADASFAAPLRNALAPHMETIQAANATPEQAVAYLFDINERLLRGTPEVKAATFHYLMQSAGLTAESLGLTTSDEQAPYVDPEVARLRSELDAIKVESQTRSQAESRAMRQRAEQELDSFLSATPGAGDLMNDMLPFLRSGLTLAQAHEKAVWLNPVTRQAKIDSDAKAKIDAAAQTAAEKAQAAAKASSVNVKATARNGSPTAPVGSIDDTMREVYAKMSR